MDYHIVVKYWLEQIVDPKLLILYWVIQPSRIILPTFQWRKLKRLLDSSLPRTGQVASTGLTAFGSLRQHPIYKNSRQAGILNRVEQICDGLRIEIRNHCGVLLEHFLK